MGDLRPDLIGVPPEAGARFKDWSDALAFVFGSHLFLGSNLAWLETRVALDVVLEPESVVPGGWGPTGCEA